MDRSAQLGQASIPRLLLRFSLPAIVGIMAQASYNLIDRVFVGHALSSEGIAGTTVAFPFMLVVLAFAMLIGFGGTALISIRLGEGKKAQGSHALDAIPAIVAPDSSDIDSAAFLRPGWSLGCPANVGFRGLPVDRHLLAGGVTGVEGETAQ